MSYLIWPLISIALLISLSQRGRILVPPRFGIWMLFLAWLVVSAVQLDAPDRMMAWMYRGSMYLSATLLLLYVYNSSRRDIPTMAIVKFLAIAWAMIVLGGILSNVLPGGVELRSPVQLVIPEAIAQVELVQDMVTPEFSKDNAFPGIGIHRTQAPFPYPNAWGSNFVLLTPFALWLFLQSSNSRWKFALGGLLVISLLPFVSTLDRGAWFALAVGFAYGGIRLAAVRDTRVIKWGVIGLVALGAVMVLTPLRGIVQERLERNYSDRGRIGRNVIALDLASEKPLYGYGAPQASEDNPANAAVGTHGQLWLVLVSGGIVGAVLFFGWLGFLTVWSGRRLRSASDPRFWPHIVFVMALIMSAYYELLPLQLHTIMVAAAIALRDGQPGEIRPGGARLTAYSEVVRRNWKLIGVGGLVGLLIGLTVVFTTPKTFTSTARVEIPIEAGFPIGESDRLETEAIVAVSDAVLGPALAAMPNAGLSADEARELIEATALPETRVLELTVVHSDPVLTRRLANQVAFAVVGAWQTDYESVALLNAEDLVERAILGERVSRELARRALAAGLAGLVLGTALAFMIGDVRGRAASLAELERTLGCSVLGVVPRSERGRRARAAADAYRLCGANLARLLPEGGVVAICRAPGMGGFVAEGLTAALSASGHAVVRVGLLPSGNQLASATTSRSAELVIVDAPPLGIADGLAPLHAADRLVVVLEAKRETASTLSRLRESCERTGLIIHGAIVVGAPPDGEPFPSTPAKPRTRRLRVGSRP
jgi:capsular polysaccharide biosynthesis protein